MIPFGALPAIQIPRPDPLPLAGPAWLFTLLLLVTFFLHILTMNVVLGGSILAVVARMKAMSHPRSSLHRELSQTLVRMLPVAVAYAITFGVATLLFAQILYGRLLYTSSILMGWYWFLVVPILILVYYGVYYAAFKENQFGWKGLTTASLSALLFLLIAFVYSNNMSLMLRPETFLTKYAARPTGLSLNLGDTTLLPRYLHMVMGALAVTGLFTALAGLLRQRKQKEFGIWATRQGLLLFAGATSLNLILGTWFLLSFSRDNLLQFMRGQPLGITALALGIIFALAMLGCGVLALHSEKSTLLIKGAAGMLILTLLSMIVLRDQIRRAVLSTVYVPASWEIPHWTLIWIFFTLIAASVVTIVWMLKRLLR